MAPSNLCSWNSPIRKLRHQDKPFLKSMANVRYVIVVMVAHQKLSLSITQPHHSSPIFVFNATVTHFVSSRRWANPCTSRDIWRHIQYIGHPVGRCPIEDLHIRNNRSVRKPSMAGNCAESCSKSDKSNPAVFSCTRAFSAKNGEKIVDNYWRLSANMKSTWSQNAGLFFLSYVYFCFLYQLFVVECSSWQNWSQAGIAFRCCHRLEVRKTHH